MGRKYYETDVYYDRSSFVIEFNLDEILHFFAYAAVAVVVVVRLKQKLGN